MGITVVGQRDVGRAPASTGRDCTLDRERRAITVVEPVGTGTAASSLITPCTTQWRNPWARSMVERLDPYLLMAVLGKRYVHPRGRRATGQLLTWADIDRSCQVLCRCAPLLTASAVRSSRTHRRCAIHSSTCLGSSCAKGQHNRAPQSGPVSEGKERKGSPSTMTRPATALPRFSWPSDPGTQRHPRPGYSHANR